MGTINMSANVEKSSKPKKAKATTKKADAAAHPPSSVMVVKAIEDLKERKGSSLAAIKKYIGCFRWYGRKIQDCENREQAEAKEDCQKGNPFKEKGQNLLLKRQHLKRLKKQNRQQRQRQPSLRNPWQRNRRKSQLLKRRRPRKSSD